MYFVIPPHSFIHITRVKGNRPFLNFHDYSENVQISVLDASKKFFISKIAEIFSRHWFSFLLHQIQFKEMDESIPTVLVD
jgi:hypothetical protein